MIDVNKKIVEERFWSKVDKTDNCWNWMACLDNSGYGHFIFNHKNERAHRVSWILHYRNILKGLCICHHCDNRKCVRPSHLFLGTQKDNVQDAVRKGRARGGMLRGSKHGRSKLKENQIAEIRNLYKASLWTQEKLSKKFGVSRGMIGHIVNFKSWNHVQNIDIHGQLSIQ